MRILETVEEVRLFTKKQRQSGAQIGLVPTMGYFHEGHLELMRQASNEGNAVITSIFVNPKQFGPNEDLDRYPRDLDRDRSLAENAGVDALFVPRNEEIYPAGYQTYVHVERLTEGLCGRSRPGHFRGVATVVAKLFNIVQPDCAYFGLKDAQQTRVMEKMVADLNFSTRIITVPIVREADGLARSSRNVCLNPLERKSAPVLYRSLLLAKDLIQKGERDAGQVIKAVKELIGQEPFTKVDYVEIRDWEQLEEIKTIQGKVLVALAVWLGKTRLIDNLILEV